MPIEDYERKECNDSALFCLGTAYIFEKRLVPLKVAGKLLVFSSLAGPLSIGALVISVGAGGKIFESALYIASILSCIQILVSLWSIVSGWQSNISSYETSVIENHLLSDEFKQLADRTNISDSKWRIEKELLETKGKQRKREDLKLNVSDEESRMGMRYALRFFERPCPGCKKVPLSLNPSDCDICGKFKTRRIKWLM